VEQLPKIAHPKLVNFATRMSKCGPTVSSTPYIYTYTELVQYIHGVQVSKNLTMSRCHGINQSSMAWEEVLTHDLCAAWDGYGIEKCTGFIGKVDIVRQP
jgi:hypothetical protein